MTEETPAKARKSTEVVLRMGPNPRSHLRPARTGSRMVPISGSKSLASRAQKRSPPSSRRRIRWAFW